MTVGRPLSVVHFSTADIDGGSARSAWRIHRGLLDGGHHSRMLVGYKLSEDATVDTVSGGGILRRADEICNRLTAAAGLQYLLLPSSLRLPRHPWLARPDLIQLYNTHGGYFSPALLPALSRRAPLVWRLSDMWPVTGHCAYAGPCGRWREGCGACPDLAAYPPLGLDTTAALWRWKRALYLRCRLTVVAPSSWIEDIAKASPLFAGCAVHRIPNGLDLTVFRPLERPVARAVLGLPPDGTALLFSAHVAGDNPRKGSGLLQQALQRLGPRPDLTVLVAGKGAESWVGTLPQRVIALGYLRDDRLIAAANAAADFLVAPSAVENLPNTILEAMAARRPVVAFDAGGIRDAVRPGETGLLVPGGAVEALAAAIAALAEDEPARQRMGRAALELVRAEFSAESQARRFERLYRSLIEDAPP